jgi:transposase
LRYSGGGCSSYHPRMMLKVLIYSYSQKIYSSRMIAKALRENIQFMWIAGSNRPDFRTINRFRSHVMNNTIEKIFTSVVELLLEKGLVSFEHYFVDGTKIESAANKYTFVWKRSTEKYRKKLQSNIRELFTHIDAVSSEENRRYGDRDLEEIGEGVEITAAEVEEVIKRINEDLNEADETPKELEKLKKEDLPRLKKYEEQLRVCGNRNSYSKTDHDATFMRMKEDHMRNGQLKPGYNVQIGTENQFILGYSVHQKPTDTTTLIPHLNKLKQQHNRLPNNIIGDAGYGSEENYNYLKDEKLGNYLKYNYFHVEHKRKFRNDPFRRENLPYDAEHDRYICPAGQHLIYVEKRNRHSDNGYNQETSLYECEDCRWCRSRKLCHKSKYNRKIEINNTLNAFKAQARDNLTSVKGKKLRSRRPIEVESVFGHIKQNRGFRRFLLRGMNKVTIEWGLLSIAHNFLKMNTVMA